MLAALWLVFGSAFFPKPKPNDSRWLFPCPCSVVVAVVKGENCLTSARVNLCQAAFNLTVQSRQKCNGIHLCSDLIILQARFCKMYRWTQSKSCCKNTTIHNKIRKMVCLKVLIQLFIYMYFFFNSNYQYLPLHLKEGLIKMQASSQNRQTI